MPPYYNATILLTIYSEKYINICSLPAPAEIWIRIIIGPHRSCAGAVSPQQTNVSKVVFPKSSRHNTRSHLEQMLVLTIFHLLYFKVNCQIHV